MRVRIGRLIFNGLKSKLLFGSYGEKSSVKLAVAALLLSASVASAMSDVAQLVIERKTEK